MQSLHQELIFWDQLTEPEQKKLIVALQMKDCVLFSESVAESLPRFKLSLNDPKNKKGACNTKPICWR